LGLGWSGLMAIRPYRSQSEELEGGENSLEERESDRFLIGEKLIPCT
jgi:hypothetical protein